MRSVVHPSDLSGQCGMITTKQSRLPASCAFSSSRPIRRAMRRTTPSSNGGLASYEPSLKLYPDPLSSKKEPTEPNGLQK